VRTRARESAAERPGLRLLAAPPLGILALAQESAGHADRFLGIPLWIWELANLALFLGLLFILVARPLARAFRSRQLAVEERAREARRQRDEAVRLESEIRERMARLDREISEIRSRGESEGEVEKRALVERGAEESARVRRQAQEEIERRLADAKDELRRTAADLTASAAVRILAGEITDEDRRRLLDEGVERLGRGAR
jgi:F-type H+-transporting ATPase subunit b